MPDLYRDGSPVLIRQNGIAETLKRVKILISKNAGDKWPFTERWLQEKIHHHPECLPIHDIEPGLGTFRAIAMEVPTPSGYIDNLLMSSNGDIALVEVKLFHNPEARRQVIAQALDYAAALFGMDYADFERAALKGSQLRAPKASLHDQFDDATRLEEKDFIEAVSTNLRRGRILVLIAGDGIRSELGNLVEQVDRFAQMRFTLALIELAVFHMPDGGFLIRPSTLVKTQFVTRTVFDYAAPGSIAGVHTIPADMSADAYWEALSAKIPDARPALEALLNELQKLGVAPDFQASLNLKWDAPERGKPINFIYIQRNGMIWTDMVAWTAPQDVSRRYVERLAQAWDGEVHMMPKGTSWTIYKDGKPIKLSAVLDRLSALPPLIQKFQQEMLEVAQA